MSAGDELAGDGFAGEPGVPVLPSVPRARPAAIHFDGTSRDFTRDSDGRYTAIHPVDSRVEMALMVEFGRFGSSASTGHSLRDIRYLDPTRLGAEVRDRVRRALKRLTDAGDITIENIEHDARAASGALLVGVDYFNERLPDRARRRFTPSGGVSGAT